MFNRHQYYSLDALKQMHHREIDYVNRKLSRNPEWLGSQSFHARMQTIRVLQMEIRWRESNRWRYEN